MKLVEQHIIKRSDPRYKRIDEAAFASKNLWNLANYYVRQAFIHEQTYLDNTAVYQLVKVSDAYKAALVGIQVILTEESYTSRASFLDRDAIPVYDPARTEEPRFSGRRDGRWYYTGDKRIIHSDVNGSYNIGRKVAPTAFEGLGVGGVAARPRRLAV
jgi:hypothetical protein